MVICFPHSWQFMQLFSDSDPRDFIFHEGDPLGGEKFFKCTVCDYKAKKQSNAIRHVKFMHLNFSENL